MSRFYRTLGATPAKVVIPLHLTAAQLTPTRAAAPAPSASPGFWAQASGGEKVAIVGGAGVTAFLLWLAFKK